MYISKIHLQGFKSFLNKTDMSFGKGITAIVGPNGCGKSNIVDAIRWIIGEQKASTLRSKTKEDIIFNGTKKKKPLNFCEASMLIHNSDKILPIEYEKVLISRRLYRSGESEYYINKTQCRLKDIHSLFVDTGMSSNAYSVIELKMIDAILSDNAQDRIKMFEEAAGINNYKKQRDDAIKKIKITCDDMDRVNDITSEVESNVKRLSTQIKKYKKHSILKEKIKSIDIKYAQKSIHLLNSKFIPIENKLESLRNKHFKLSKQTTLDETLLEKKEAQFFDKNNAHELISKEVNRLESKILTINSNKLVLSEKISGNENRKKFLKDEIDHCKKNILLYDEKMENINSQIKKNNPLLIEKKKVHQNKKNNYEKVCKTFDLYVSEQQSLKEEVDKINFKKNENQLKIEALISLLKDKSNEISLNEKKINQILLSIETLNGDANLLDIKLNKIISQGRKVKKIFDDLSAKKLLLKKKSVKIDNQINLYINQKDIIQSKIDFYKNLLKTRNGSSEGVQFFLNNNKKYPFIIGVLSDLIKVDKKYELIVENILGSLLDYLVVEKKSEAKMILADTDYDLGIIILSNIDYEKKIESAFIEKITFDSKLEKMINILFGDIYVHGIDKSKGRKKYKKLIDKDSNYFIDDYIVKKTGKKKYTSIGSKNKIEAYILEMDKVSLDIERNIAESKKLNVSINNIDIENTKNKNSIDGYFEERKEVERLIDKNSFILFESMSQKKEIKSYLMKCQENVAIMQSEIQDLRKNNVQYEISIKKIDNELQVANEKVEQIRINRNIQNEELQDSKIYLMEIEKEIEGLIERKKTYYDQNMNYKETIDRHRLDMLSIDGKKKIILNTLKSDKAELSKISLLRDKVYKEKNGIEMEVMKLSSELKKIKITIKDFIKDKDVYLNKIQQSELVSANIKNEIKSHKQRIKNLYLEDLKEDLIVDDCSVDELKNKISKYQLQIDAIGPINMAVSEEYEKEIARYDFLINQFDDLKKTEIILNETIEKLDNEAIKKYLIAFDLINKNFKKTFSNFFNGGDAQLSLDNIDDPLGRTINIMVTPPGKNTRSLRALSAGEKALTAIALLFAIYLVKPSPFCILDEVDAPLDDNNINKFTSALKLFADKTQFIVVTHNKLTMEKADYLYGITQAEKGISKLVSLDFNKNNSINALA